MQRIALCLALCLAACGSSSRPDPTPPSPQEPQPQQPQPPAGAACIKTGCSGTVCAEPGQDMVTTCEFKAEYACYQSAVCERQADGRCGWTQSAELTACIASPPAAM